MAKCAIHGDQWCSCPAHYSTDQPTESDSPSVEEVVALVANAFDAVDANRVATEYGLEGLSAAYCRAAEEGARVVQSAINDALERAARELDNGYSYAAKIVRTLKSKP